MSKKSTNVKTYELRRNDLYIMLKQLTPASNKNYGKVLHKVRQSVRKMEWKLLHIKHILYMQPFGALKIAPQSVGNKNGTKAVLQGWAAAFVPYMLSFTYGNTA